MKIKFGTDGWRAIIAHDYTTQNVSRVAYATALRLKKDHEKPSVVIGYDCRFGGELFAETVAGVLMQEGIRVYFSKGISSTPMVSLGVTYYQANQGIIITASHNPPSYNGFKLKSKFGGPSAPSFVEEVENLIPDVYNGIPMKLSEGKFKELLTEVNLESIYVNAIESKFNINLIKDSGMNLAYDAMYGAGQQVMRHIFPDAILLHCELNPGFDGQAPEPIHKNLTELSEVIKISEDIDLGLATDGDADRIGLYNSSGRFIDSHHIILLLIHYLHKVKGYNGQVVKSFSCTSKIDAMCEKYGLQCKTTKIGFKYICETMVTEDVLVGGEESGGIAIKGHLPERDGIWIGLTIAEMMAVSGKSLDELIEEIYSVVGSFAVERYDEHVEESLKQKIIEYCKQSKFTQFGQYTVIRTENLDGFKFYLDEGSWVMLRASGTEPVLRIYCESKNSEECFQILDTVRSEVLAI